MCIRQGGLVLKVVGIVRFPMGSFGGVAIS
jgi:hypothetical protein